MKFARLTPCAAAVAAAILQMANPAQAATCTLTTNGLWQTTTDWSCNARPGSGDSATINIGGLVTINQAEQITTLANAGTINIDAFTLTLLGGGSTINTGTINVGGAATAALQVQNNITNTGGTINVANGSVINQFGTTITGGTIATTGTGALVATNNGNNFLDSVSLNGTLDLATNTGVERISGSGLTLNGAININNNSTLAFNGGTQTLGGSGTITFGNTGGSNQLTIDGNGTLTTSANTLIHGQNGTIGGQAFVGGSATTLNNGGTISADVAGGVINLVPMTTNNSSTLSAKNGGELLLNTAVNNTGAGRIDVIGAGSTVLQNGVTITGGTINTSGGGTFVAANNGNNRLSAATLNGTLDLATNTGVERVLNGITLTTGSNVNINSNSVLSFDGGGSQTLGGTGTITLGNTGGSNRLSVENAGTLTIGSGILIHGANGTIGGQDYAGGGSTIINNGTIAADVSGGTITLATNNAAANAIQNNSVLSATNGGTLVFNSSVAAGAGSSINVGANSAILQNGVTLTGVINTTGNGSFVSSNNGNNYLNGVTLNGTLDLATNTGVERITNGLTLNGSVNVNNNSTLVFAGGTQTLGGAATITLGNTGASNQIGIDSGGTLNVASGVLIHGTRGTIGGQVYVGGANTLNNSGTITSDVAGGQLVLQASTINNSSVISAKNGGQILLNNVVNNLGSGHLDATGTGSTLLQNGISINGGTINTSTGGLLIATNSGANYLNGVTLNGTLDLATNTGVERITNGLTLNGSVNLNNNSTLAFAGGTQTLGGAATITLGNTGASNQIGIDSGATLNVASGVLIHGSTGTIGGAVFVGGAGTLDNSGTISSDVSGGRFTIASSTTNNSGVISAQNGGQILLNYDIGNVGSGHLDAIGAGSTIVQNGITVNGGTVNTSSGGLLIASNSGGNYLNGVTLNGTLDLATNTGVERITNGLTLNGNVNLNNNSTLAFAGGTQTVAGNGTITLGNTGASNTIAVDNTGTLNIASGVTINGQNGTVGGQVYVGGPSTLNNAGTINASVAGGLITVAANTLTNNGTLAATAGTLDVATNQGFTGTGTVLTSGTGQVNFHGFSTVGTLTNNGTGATALNLNDYTVTVSSDYNNSHFGTGDNFNKHANVSSSGSINASGTTGQAVTGATVSDGTGYTPTLVIGNVRVGTGTTYNYQVANTGGSDSPSIRGALQTGVNGGNITDGRLTGSGVTAGNYGPIAGGANGGNLGVTFTTNVAGAIAPLSGQAVHIANNFDNVTEQTLGIVLGAGAGAYNVAQSNVPTTVNLGNVHVGMSASQAVTIGNTNISPAGYQEGLDVSVGTRSAGATGTGSISNLAAGGTSNNVIVGLSNIGAGNRSGTVALNLASNGSTTSGLDTLALAPKTVTVNATGYNLASASVTQTPIVFANAHVGDTRSQALTVSNTGPAGAYTEGLTGSIGSVSGTGVVGTGGTTAVIAAQSTSTALGVKLDTASAGAKSGSVSVNFNSDGSGTSGLGTTALASQSVTVGGNVYNLASSSTIGAINFGLHHVGDGTITQNVAVTNIAAGGNYSEGLDTSFGAVGGTGAGRISTSGVVTNLAAQSSDSSTLKVSLDTSQVGTVNGNVRVIQASNGTISGLANTALPDQNPAVTADIQASGMTVRYAVGQINNAPVSFGAVRINTAQNQALSITNAVPNDGFSESLVAGIAGTSGKATGSGGFGTPTNVPALAASATDSTHVIVGLDTSAAGHQTGNVSVNFKSDGTAFAGGTITDRGNTAVNVTGDVYRLASPTVASTSITVAARAGTTGPTTSIGVTNKSPDVYTEALSVTLGATSAGFTSSGGITNLVAGGSSSAIGVTLDTATAGTFSGTQALNFMSTGAGTDHAADISVGSGSVVLNGKVYTAAVAQNNTPSVDFGIVHVGDTVASKGVSVTNTASVTALNDVLVGAAVGASGPFSASGNLGAGLAAQQTSANGLQVGLNTATAGTYSGSATFSAASHDNDLSDAALANLAVSLVGQVNNYASDTFAKTGGAGSLTRSGSTYVLDYGTVAQNSGTVTSSLVATNDATGPADALDGMFQFLDAADFGEGGFAAFMGLAAGSSDGPLTFSFDTATAGSFMDTIVLHGVGSNASGYSVAIGDIRLIVRGTVNAAVTPPTGDVPEPDSLLLLGLGLPLLFLRRGRKQRAH